MSVVNRSNASVDQLSCSLRSSTLPGRSGPLTHFSNTSDSFEKAHPRTDVRDYVATLLSAIRANNPSAREAAQTLGELSHEQGFRGLTIRAALLEELASYETTFLKNTIIGQPLPPLLNFLSASTKLLFNMSSDEIPVFKRNSWIKIINAHLYSLTFQTGWNEELLLQLDHTTELAQRLFFEIRNTPVLGCEQKSSLGNAIEKTLLHASTQFELLSESSLFSQSLAELANLPYFLGLSTSADALKTLFAAVHRTYIELSPRDYGVGDYFRYCGQIWQPDDGDHTTNTTQPLDSEILDSEIDAYAWDSYSLDDETYSAESLIDDDSQSGESSYYDGDSESSHAQEEERIVSANRHYQALEILHIELIRLLQLDPIASFDEEFWHGLVYENSFFMPAMPIALQALACTSLKNTMNCLEPVLYAMGRDDAAIVQILALLEVRDPLFQRFGIDVSELLINKLFELPETIQEEIISRLETNIDGDLSLINQLSESLLTEEEMSIIFGTFLRDIYDRLDGSE